MSLSVIIPNYNNEKYIKKCIQSVLDQTLRPDSIIIIDDCSTDSSASIIRDFENSCDIIKAVYLDENNGVSAARNIGIGLAETEYITMLDGDDFYYERNKLKNEMKLISGLGEKAAVYSKLVYCDENDEIIRYLDYPDKEYFQGDISCALISGRVTRTLMRDYVFPKSVIESTGLYNEKMSLFEDYDFLIRLSRELKFYCTFEYGTAYRQKQSGLSHKPAQEVFSAKRAVMKSYSTHLSFALKLKVFFNKLMKPFDRIFNKIRLVLTRKK